MIGIIGAMEEEVSVLLSETNNITTETIAGILFYKANYKNKELIIVKSGIGMVNSAIITTLLVEKFKVNSIIFSGVAGGLSKDVKVGDIIIGDSFVEYTFDVTAASDKYVRGQRAGTTKRDIDANKKLLDISKEVNIPVNIHYGRIGSADIFVSKKEDKIKLVEDFNLLAVDMESASVAHTCEVLEIPFLIIRSISDSFSDTYMEYEDFVYIACNNSKEFVLKFLERL